MKKLLTSTALLLVACEHGVSGTLAATSCTRGRHLSMRTLRTVVGLCAILGATSACEAQQSDACVSGETRPCACAGGDGEQSCASEGTWNACSCEDTEADAGTSGIASSGSESDGSGSQDTEAGETGAETGPDGAGGCYEGVPTLDAEQTVTLSSGGPGTTTGVFCIEIPDDATTLAFVLTGGSCDAGSCSSGDVVELFFKEGDLPDASDPDDETQTWEHEVGGRGEFGTAVQPGVAYLVTDDGANGLGYHGVSLSISFDGVAGSGGDEACQRTPEADPFACPPGFPPFAHRCDGAPPFECVPGAGPEFCCPS